MIILHNARPLPLIQKAARNIAPVVVVHHGGRIKYLDGAEHVICVAHYMMDEIKNSKARVQALYYLPNAMNIKDIVARNYKSEEEKRQGLRIGYIGRLSPEKGVDILLAAVSKLPIPYMLSIAGDGEEKLSLEKLAAQLDVQAQFLGWVDGEKKAAFFRNIDVLIVPSRHEPFGLVILDAWNNRVPVISSASKGGMELIEQIKDGIIFDVGDADGLRDALLNFIACDSEGLAENGLKKLEANYSKVAFERNLAAICAEITGRYSGAH